MAQMTADHQAQGDQGPDDGEAGLNPHGVEQGIQFEWHIAPVVGGAHHQRSKECKQRNPGDQPRGLRGVILANRPLRHRAA
ncbi:hypothetical protein D3C85_1503580 [compost metagenome]